MYQEIYYGFNKIRVLAKEKDVYFVTDQKDSFSKLIVMNLNHYLKTSKSNPVVINFFESNIPKVIIKDYNKVFNFYCGKNTIEYIFNKVILRGRVA